MFMVCSGGGWWYRFCRQPDTTAYPPMSTATAQTNDRHNGGGPHLRRASDLNRRGGAAGRTIHNANNDQSALYLQRIWKGKWALACAKLWKSIFFMSPLVGQPNYHPPPNYYNSGGGGGGGGSSVVTYHNNGGHTDASLHVDSQSVRCPYYQLYGPPPSYESVVQLANGIVGIDIGQPTIGQPTCVLLTAATSIATCATTTTTMSAVPPMTTLGTVTLSSAQSIVGPNFGGNATDEDDDRQVASSLSSASSSTMTSSSASSSRDDVHEDDRNDIVDETTTQLPQQSSSHCRSAAGTHRPNRSDLSSAPATTVNDSLIGAAATSSNCSNVVIVNSKSVPSSLSKRPPTNGQSAMIW